MRQGTGGKGWGKRCGIRGGGCDKGKGVRQGPGGKRGGKRGGTNGKGSIVGCLLQSEGPGCYYNYVSWYARGKVPWAPLDKLS